MRFQPKTEDELKTWKILPEADYDYVIDQAIDKISQQGNDMIEIKLRVFGPGYESHIFDYLLESMGHKLRHICESTGLLSKYDSGEVVAEDLIGRAGICRIGIEKAKGKYKEKNRVDDYIVKQRDIHRPEVPVTSDKVCPPGIDPITGEPVDGTPF